MVSLFRCLIGNTYSTPTRKTLTNTFLPAVYKAEVTSQVEELAGSRGTLLIDGWSAHSTGLAASCFANKQVANFIDAFPFDEAGQTAAVYMDALDKSYETITNTSAKVVGYCSDNCNTMLAVRSQFEEAHPDILCYGCSDHLINLEAKDFVLELNLSTTIERITAIQRVFKSHLKFRVALVKEGGKIPSIPGETRWHFTVDMVENFTENIGFMQACLNKNKDLKEEMKTRFSAQANDLQSPQLEIDANELLKLILPFRLAIKDIESDNTSCEKVVSIWLDLVDHVEGLDSNLFYVRLYAQGKKVAKTKTAVQDARVQSLKKRMAMALSPGHYAASLISPNFLVSRLSFEQKQIGLSYLNKLGLPNSFLTSFAMKDYTCLAVPNVMTIIEESSQLSLKEFWQQVAFLSSSSTVGNVAEVCLNLDALVSSTASQERVFSVYGATWTKLRNRLKGVNSKMLVFLRHRYADKRRKLAELKKMEKEAAVAEIEEDEEEEQEEIEEEIDNILSEDDDENDDDENYDDNVGYIRI